MTDDLIKKLHHYANGNCDMTPVCSTLLEAADHIEELVKERDEARHLQSCACNYDTPTDVCMGHHALFERLYAAERAKLEAKLAKAVEALQFFAALKSDFARKVLTELEGK